DSGKGSSTPPGSGRAQALRRSPPPRNSRDGHLPQRSRVGGTPLGTLAASFQRCAPEGTRTADADERMARAAVCRESRRRNMSITRWDPFRELEEMSERLNRVFGRSALATARAGGEAKEGFLSFDWAPSVDIAETPEAFEIKAELPDVKKEDVKVFVEDGQLRISGERKQDKEEKGKKFHRIERSYGSFMRSFALPEN